VKLTREVNKCVASKCGKLSVAILFVKLHCCNSFCVETFCISYLHIIELESGTIMYAVVNTVVVGTNCAVIP